MYSNHTINIKREKLGKIAANMVDDGIAIVCFKWISIISNYLKI